MTFSAGDQFSTPFTVKITEDTIAECTQQFTITYSIISTSVKEGAMIELLGDNATVIISDNDGEVVLCVPAYYTVHCHLCCTLSIAKSGYK